MPLFLLFLVVPIVEIALFIEIGGQIGLWTTLAIIITTAAIGSLAIRAQGRALMRSMTSSGLADAPDLMSQGLLLFVAGMFLITPGFLTDIMGLLLLIPPIRRSIRDYLMRRMTIATVGVRNARRNADDPLSSSEPLRSSSSSGPSPWRAETPASGVEDATVLDEGQPKR